MDVFTIGGGGGGKGGKGGKGGRRKKKGGRAAKKGPGGGGRNPLSRDGDGDIAMGGAAKARRQVRTNVITKRKGATAKAQGMQVETQKGKARGSRPVLQITKPAKIDNQTLFTTLRAKCPMPFTISSFQTKNGYLYVTLGAGEQPQAAALMSLSRKIQCGSGQKIFIKMGKSGRVRVVSGKTGDLPTELNPILEGVVGQRWSEADKLLNLSGLLEDPILKTHPIAGGFNNQGLADALTSIVLRHCSNMQTLDLSNNNIKTLIPLRAFAKAASGLLNLSLQNNSIKSINELNHIKAMKSLQRLIMTSNPVLTRFGERVAYEKAVRKVFPVVEELDGALMTVEVKRPALLPPMQDAYTPDEVKTPLANFFRRFFEAYDLHPRDNLILAYHPSSVFTLTAQGTSSGKDMRAYMGINHNIKKMKASSDKRFKCMFIGAESIIKCQNSLPATAHELDTLMMEVFRMDQVSIGVCVSGRFVECKSKMKRSFQRNFVLAPAPAGSQSAAAGWELVIANDQMHIGKAGKSTGGARPARAGGATGRASGGARALAGAVAAATHQGGAPRTPAAAVSLGAPQSPQEAQMQQLLAKFMEGSGLKQDMALQCLTSNNWNFDQAVADFTRLKANNAIPAQYFR